MTVKDAVLWVPHPALMFSRVAGLGVLERQLFVLRRAGLAGVWIGTPRPPEAAGLRLPEGLAVRWAEPGGTVEAPVKPPYLSVSGDHLVRLAALRRILSETPDRPVSWKDAQGRGVLQLVLSARDDQVGFESRPFEAGASVFLTQPPRDAVEWIVKDAVKGTDGFMARHFDRRISLAVTRRLLDTVVMPNHMTFVSVGFGLAGAALLAVGTYGASLAGALLVWLHSTLDGCDGELARLRFQESPLGGVLDFWGDNVVHAALFLGLGLGLSRAHGALWPLALGLVAAASASASAALAYAHSRRKAAAAPGPGPFFSGVAEVAAQAAPAERRLAALEDSLAQRDFIYALVVLAALGRTGWFLWAAALGSPAFLAVLVWLHRPRRPAS
ncbi:MAG: CDP-alcohol phosphatidyltransferase family protein [Elusimicrobia bacterium]|nr:CDP-alcohol phosphatidyltransferase family protein [Elusimicrobiota bacterium]